MLETYSSDFRPTHTIASLGSHSALDVSEGAKKEGFSTIVVAQKGREKTYSKYYKSRLAYDGSKLGVVDDTLILNKFSDIINPENIAYLNKANSIFVPNRSFAVYVGYDNIENKFPIKIFGNRFMLRAEERDAPKNQYELMEKSNIPHPKILSSPNKINRLSIVKVSEAKRSYERAFFLVRNYDEYVKKSETMISEGKITQEGLQNATIEEYIVGAFFNFNFFYSPLNNRLELLGIDARRQTNIDGFVRLPADEQIELLKFDKPTTIEVGHIACTLRESLLEQVFNLGEKVVSASKSMFKKGIIGPFALQGAIEEKDGEKFVCFDISLRIPGSPGTRYTPYSSYLFRNSISFGRRIAMEIKQAEKEERIEEITT